MPLEATMVCLDNSEWMRNGDYTPTRMEAQHDAANLVCGTKQQQNPESTVGIMTMAGNGVEVLCSPTDDMGRILSASTGIKIGGRAQLGAALQVAQLALKHRKNKNGGQRVVVFVGSPIDADERKLVKIGKQLKKGNVAVDIVSLGETETNEAKLQALIEAVNKNNNSHYVAIPKGVLPSDVLISSAIITGDDSGGGGGGGDGGAFAEFGGVNPDLDPELAIAIRASMEAARADAERAAAATGGDAAPAASSSAPPAAAAAAGAAAAAAAPPSSSRSSSSRAAPARAAPAAADDDAMDDDEAMLQQALMMSMAETGGGATAEEEARREEQDRKRAADARGRGGSSSGSGSGGSNFLDEAFVQGLLTGLPGVDVNDPAIQAALREAGGGARASARRGGGDDDDDDDEDDDGDKKDKKKKRKSKR